MLRERFTTDPAHGRAIPRGVNLAAAIRAFMRRLRMSALPAIRAGRRFDFAAWLKPMIEAVTPAYAQLLQRGIEAGQREIVQGIRRRRRPKRLASMIRKDAADFGQRLFGGFDVFNPKVLEHLRHEVFRFCESTLDTITTSIGRGLENFRLGLAEGLSEGKAIIDLNRAAMEVFDDPERAARAAMTEASRAVNGGHLLAAVDSGVVSGKVWLASSDACQLCLSLAAMGPIDVDRPFYVHPKGGPYAVIMHAPAHPFCVTGDTTIKAASLVAATKTNYQGPIVRIEFSDGSSVGVTPNHMLLCSDGFSRAADLVEGDDVLRACPVESEGFPDFDNPNNYRKPAFAQQVFDSLSVSSGVASSFMPVSAEYLHGDAAFGQGNIHVVRSDSFLRDRLDSEIDKPLEHLQFVFGGLGIRLFCGRYLASPFKALLAATNGRVGRRRELAALLRGVAGIPNELGFRPTANWQAKALEATGYDRAADVERIRHAKNAFPGIVTTAKVVKIDVEFSSHCVSVYDFETDESMYLVGNGIISSNCMCSQTFTFDESEKELGHASNPLDPARSKARQGVAARADQGRHVQ